MSELKKLKKEKKDESTKKKIATLEERIHKHQTQKEIKQKLAGVALSTSKVCPYTHTHTRARTHTHITPKHTHTSKVAGVALCTSKVC